jgi:hypothetical protein
MLEHSHRFQSPVGLSCIDKRSRRPTRNRCAYVQTVALCGLAPTLFEALLGERALRGYRYAETCFR